MRTSRVVVSGLGIVWLALVASCGGKSHPPPRDAGRDGKDGASDVAGQDVADEDVASPADTAPGDTAGPDASAEAGGDTPVDGGADVAAEVAAPDAADARNEAGSDAATEVGAEVATEAGAETATEAGAEAATEAGAEDATEAGAEAGVDAACVGGPDAAGGYCTAALAQVGTQIVATLDAGTPPTLAGGTVLDGTYVLTAWVKYGTAVEMKAETLRLSDCATTFEMLVTQGADVRAGGLMSPRAGKLEIANGCGGPTPTTLSWPYEASGTTLKILTGDATTKFLETYVRQ